MKSQIVANHSFVSIRSLVTFKEIRTAHVNGTMAQLQIHKREYRGYKPHNVPDDVYEKLL